MPDSLRKCSQKDWSTDAGIPTESEIKVGSLQRIADAVELMAKGYARLENERDRWKRWYEQELQEQQRLARSNAALKGVNTKLRKKLAALGGNPDE